MHKFVYLIFVFFSTCIHFCIQGSSLLMMDGVISTRPTTLGLFELTNQSIKDNEIGFRYHDSWKHFILRAGYYTMGERLDYPSVSHISSVAQVHFSQILLHIEVDAISFSKDGNFNIVFAIKKDYESAYKALARWV